MVALGRPFGIACPAAWATTSRDARAAASGLVLVLPGIEGEGFLNHDIAYGLNDGGVPDASRSSTGPAAGGGCSTT